MARHIAVHPACANAVRRCDQPPTPLATRHVSFGQAARKHVAAFQSSRKSFRSLTRGSGSRGSSSGHGDEDPNTGRKTITDRECARGKRSGMCVHLGVYTQRLAWFGFLSELAITPEHFVREACPPLPP